MPTRPRIDIAGYHHIINRGVQIEWRFNGRGVSSIITGIVAIMLELNPLLTRKEIQDILIANTDKIGNVEYINGHNIFYGFGKVNLSKVIDKINSI